MSLDLPSRAAPASWRPGAWSALLAFFGAGREAAGPGRGAYTLTCDPVRGTAVVTFHDAVRRSSVLEVAGHLGDLGEQLRAVRLEVSGVRGLDVRGLATLALLCAAVERGGGGGGIVDVSVSGVPAPLRRRAVAAGIQHLVPLEGPLEWPSGGAPERPSQDRRRSAVAA